MALIRQWLARLRPVEFLLLGYVAIVTVPVILRASRYPGCWWLLAAHVLIVLLVVLASRPDLGPAGRAIRELYPMILLVGLYSGLDVLNGGGAAAVHDATVQRWELALFGSQISRTWWQTHPSIFWSTVLHGAYLSYYLILTLPALWFALHRRWLGLRQFVFTVMAAFFVCYLFFVFFPVAGPYYAFPRPTGPFVETITARLVYGALASGSSYGAAFPSSHVAATLAAAVAAWRGSRRIGLILAVPTILLTIAVVYCQMHYGVDALAGLAVGVVVAWVAGRVTGSNGNGPGEVPSPQHSEAALVTG
ncbi:MAG TPA: phosphatase PAP2 family protein [Gemmatimonadales bacterium]|nr:phosphatase PAP2 family protein [Gemmatimonadales bacterium]